MKTYILSASQLVYDMIEKAGNNLKRSIEPNLRFLLRNYKYRWVLGLWQRAKQGKEKGERMCPALVYHSGEEKKGGSTRERE